MPKKIDRRSDGAPGNVVNDPRFSSMHSAPTFKKVQKDNKKIKVDERFQKVLTDDRFRAVPGAIDIYGRKAKKGAKSAAEKELDSFYQIDDSIVPEEGEEESEIKLTSSSSSASGKGSKGKGKVADGTKGEESESRLEYLNRLARGDVSGSSSESEEERFSDVDSDDSDEEGDGTAVEERGGKQRGPLDIPEEEYEEEEDGEEAHATDRLALMNCDWASLKAQDLMSVLQSFCPPGKTIDRITVYPSDYGKEKMANEVIHGPPKIWNGVEQESEVDDSDGDGSDGEDEGYDGIAAIDHDDTVIPTETKRSDKWKRNQIIKKGKEDAKENEKKAKVSKSDRKGDFKRLPGTIGLVLQDDLVTRGLNRGDDANEEELEGEAEEGENYFDGDLSKASRTDDKGKKFSGIKGKDKRNTLEREKFTGAGKGDVDGEGGFDEVALRAYELSKLKYYFAVAEISSVDAAESLMTQLDGVELGHSSMVFDLRFIPEDTSFDGRDIRDHCSSVGSDYQPPDFVVNALQHTTVQCSWDEGEKDREKKLTTISQWRSLQESELLQYIASSDSDDEEEDEDDASEGADSDSDVDDNKNMESKTIKSKQSDKQKKSAANLRKLLLGGGDDDDFEDDSEDEKSHKGSKMKVSKGKATGSGKDEGFEDDFFTNNGEEEEEEEEEDDDEEEEEVIKPVKKTSKNVKGNKKEEGDKTFTYIPEEKQLQGKEKNKKVEEDHGDETPFERMQRQLAEKKKARKAAKKLKSKGGGEGEDVSTGNKSHEPSKSDEMTELERLKAEKAELELLLSDDDEDYDMRAIHKAEKDALKGAKGKRKSRNRKPKDGEEVDVVAGGDFELDLTDNRFASLLGGDSKFGIDRTNSEFKETKAMKQILGEQRNRREREENTIENDNRDSNMSVDPTELANNDENTESIVAKLKRKFAE
eukprot:CAMPEP_0119044192 /NCGR_PEP_ID=MMETSP1177-20130426/29368_1 /TAXON_ID=2985 /ORGANISM="Ochromonas sp, Strain CCMP1899" /LENGTH=927 /DNA_ID=CAMNT_0007013849 /DNA_START=125 /DNA_END=2905 /DNA_ORIENTATION=+